MRTMEFRYGRDDQPYTSPVSVTTAPADVSGGGDYVPEDVSYERDFAPLAQKYFQQTRGMSRVARSRSFNEAADKLEGAYINRAQIRGIDEQSRNRRVDYDRSLFALESARDNARKEREHVNEIAPIQAELLGISADPSKTAAQRRRELGVFGVRNATLLTKNPIAESMYRSALNGAVDDREDNAKFTVEKWISSSRGMDDGYLKEVETRLGRPLRLDDELPVSEVIPRLSNLNKKLMEDKDKADRADSSARLREKAREETFGRISRIEIVPGTSVADAKTGKATMGPSTLKDPTDDVIISSIIDSAGSPEERMAASELPLEERLRLAKKIQVEIGLGKRNPGGTPAGPTKGTAILGLAPPKKE